MLAHDRRLALRHLGRSPGFTFVAVVSLALGIGGNGATFSLVRATTFPTRSDVSPEELVDLHETSPGALEISVRSRTGS